MSDEKPWEEELIQHPHLPERIVHGDTGEVVARIESVRYGPLFSAAPDMARAMMGVVRSFRQGYRITEAEIRTMEAALRKAGIP